MPHSVVVITEMINQPTTRGISAVAVELLVWFSNCAVYKDTAVGG